MGGFRVGAGRPKGTGKYGEETKPIRVPVRMLSKVEAFMSSYRDPEHPDHSLESEFLTQKNQAPSHLIPFYGSRVSAGLPSLADDYIERHLDLNMHLVRHPSDSFLVQAMGDSMIGAGIFENDTLIVDKSIPPKSGKIIIAALNGELTVKRLKLKLGKIWLLPENPQYQPIEITGEADFKILGVVIHVIHSL